MQGAAKRQIGDYKILERLGAGAMGEMYKGRNTISDRVEAMKIMLPSLAETSSSSMTAFGERLGWSPASAIPTSRA